MKKILAVALAVVMLAAMAISASALYNADDVMTAWVTEDETISKSFDTLYIDYESMMDVFGVSDGNAQNVITENPVTCEEAIGVRGWAGLNTEAEFNLVFGYKLNDGEYVFSEDYLCQRDDVVAAIGEYANGFDFTIEGIPSDPTLITIAFKAADGTIYDFVEFSVNGAYAPAVVEEPVAEEPEVEPEIVIAPAAQTADLAVVAIVALGAVAVAKKH